MRQFSLKMRSENPCFSLAVFILQTLRCAIEQAEVANEGAHKGLKAKTT